MPKRPLIAHRRTTLSDRVRAFMRPRMRALGWGSWKTLTRYLDASPVSYRKLKPPEVSMMFSTGTRPIDLDTLEDVAAFLTVGIPSLLGLPDSGDLNQIEQRMVLALRVLSPAQQGHFLAVLETMSVYVRAHHIPAVSDGEKRARTHGSSLEVPEEESYETIIAAIDQQLRALEALESRRQVAASRVHAARSAKNH